MTHQLVKTFRKFTREQDPTEAQSDFYLRRISEEHPELYFIIDFLQNGDIEISGYPKQLEFDFTE